MEGTPLILLVEDNPRDAELTMLALERSGVPNEVVLAHDGAEALDMLFSDRRRLPRAPRLVLLDLKLPKVDGVELLERIRTDERTALLPIVILTSSDEERDLKACYERHANSYIRKSGDFTEFTAAVRQISQYWLSLNIGPRSDWC